jgi:hypothetical protein
MKGFNLLFAITSYISCFGAIWFGLTGSRKYVRIIRGFGQNFVDRPRSGLLCR